MSLALPGGRVHCEASKPGDSSRRGDGAGARRGPEPRGFGTITNAILLDMADKLGSLEAGKLADVIVVDGKPDENLDDLQRIDLVAKDGVVLVKSGQIVTPRHVPEPLRKPAPPQDVR
jgi:cytosine/adenosine deaminase-related metal-dependent hydrolase